MSWAALCRSLLELQAEPSEFRKTEEREAVLATGGHAGPRPRTRVHSAYTGRMECQVGHLP